MSICVVAKYCMRMSQASGIDASRIFPVSIPGIGLPPVSTMGPDLAITAGRQVVQLSSAAISEDVLGSLFEEVQVDQKEGVKRLYKPAVLAAMFLKLTRLPKRL